MKIVHNFLHPTRSAFIAAILGLLVLPSPVSAVPLPPMCLPISFGPGIAQVEILFFPSNSPGKSFTFQELCVSDLIGNDAQSHPKLEMQVTVTDPALIAGGFQMQLGYLGWSWNKKDPIIIEADKIKGNVARFFVAEKVQNEFEAKRGDIPSARGWQFDVLDKNGKPAARAKRGPIKCVKRQ